jgi:tRNA pseudouridine38-40 synthase
VRIALLIAYDGGPFHGYAENLAVRTIAGDVRAALETVFRQPVEMAVAGRTDAGVHARCQVITIDVAEQPFDRVRIRRALNKLCGPAIVVRDLAVVPATFDARFSARTRCYRYRILNAPVPDPLRAGTTWHVAAALDRAAMADATTTIVGEHDFASFCRRIRPSPGRVAPSLVRRVLRAEWTEPDDDGLFHLEIEAVAFCHQMVRTIVGTVVDVGRGRLAVDDVAALLAAKDRSRGVVVAPPHGLVLWSVTYEGGLPF